MTRFDQSLFYHHGVFSFWSNVIDPFFSSSTASLSLSLQISEGKHMIRCRTSSYKTLHPCLANVMSLWPFCGNLKKKGEGGIDFQLENKFEKKKIKIKWEKGRENWIPMLAALDSTIQFQRDWVDVPHANESLDSSPRSIVSNNISLPPY